MKLHRLVLTNYRGIVHREIEFPDRGVVVVSGANEIGKSSMIEALDLLLEAKDRSSKKEVKQVKPTHADVGAEITADISTGPYRFVYRKRFHKRAETELTVLAPRREQLTGDEAHDRVRAMLEETVDTCLWQAQRVLQSTATEAVDLSGCDALSRALDVAAGAAVAPTDASVPSAANGTDTLLVDRIETEYLNYFTRTGRPTGEWAAAQKRLQAADQELARCAAAIAEVDDAVRRHAELTEELARLTAARTDASKQLTAAQAAAEAVAALAGELKQAELVAAAAEAGRTAAATAVNDRRALRDAIDGRAEAIVELEASAAEAAEALATAAEVKQAADVVAEEARTAMTAAQGRADAARRTVDQLVAREEADRLAGMLAKIAGAQRDLDSTEAELASIALTGEGMRAIEAANSAVDVAMAQVELMSAHLELVAIADVEVRVGGEVRALEAGQSWSTGVSSQTEIEVPGVLTARLAPSTPASETHAKLEAAQQLLASELAKAGVADVAAARALDQRRLQLVTTRDRLVARIEALTGDASVDQLQTRLAELTARQPVAADLFEADADAARAELQAATTAAAQAIADCEKHRKVAEAAAKQLGERETRVALMREKLTTEQGQLTLARDQLARQRGTTADEELTAKAETCEQEARRANTLVAELSAELAKAAPDAVAAALNDATRRAEEVGREHDEVAEALREVKTQLKVYGTEGRKGQLDAAETEREHAEAEYLRVQRRARAAELLRSVIIRHRDATRLRYVDPFRTEVERLGRLVFGDSFEVEIDSDLKICSRTLSGRTVPYESLSGGAKEQLGIVARLAGAALVAKEDTVPVVIDDALGFTDADRLVKMGAVFNAVGGDGQVIVLTCSPQRYAAVEGAHHIALSA
ncbi:AAA family ATPase [Mycobacterium barrassiae]|uniref:AAA family ATPase n=1 Tax=Mycobacterium barrassiae TaxID=319709 RepID=UPI002265C0B8|nr:AAA family ATPase [Mycobacterium barrassiae]MCV7301401.1 AAA family ATPase [Mycobacterium barrassiae]